jgi:WD40 repeat protein
VDTGHRSAAPLLHPGPVMRVAFTADGRTLATICGDNSARLWDMASGKPIGATIPHRATSIAFSPDGRTLLTGGREGMVQFWAVPPPLPGVSRQISLWTRIVTGSETDSNGILYRLDAQALRRLRLQWERLGAVPAL